MAFITYLNVFLNYQLMLLLSHHHELDIRRYDYLEFTDSRGGKVRYDMKVGTEKWPKVGYENPRELFPCEIHTV